MPTPNLIQQQRNLLHQFRANNRQRARAETDAETRYKTELSTAKTDLNQIRQTTITLLAAAQKAKEEAHTLLAGANLPRLLGQTPASGPTPNSTSDPSQELRRVVTVVTDTAKDIPALLAALNQRRKTDATRRQVWGAAIIILLFIAIPTARNQWQNVQRANQAKAMVTAQANATEAAIVQANVVATRVAVQFQAAEAQAQAAAFAKEPALKPLAERFGMQFVEVAAGELIMGSVIEGGDDDEHPQHTLFLNSYWIGLTEVTNAQYNRFVNVGGYNQPELWTENGWSWRQANNISGPKYSDDDRWNKPNQPVVGVSWFEAVAYTHWLAKETGANIRLPTEAEWEKAARGSDGRTYPWGDQKPTTDLANFGTVGSAAIVGSYPQGISPYKALDMAGNVWEWTNSIYRDYPYRPDDGREALMYMGNRVGRGGSFGGGRTIRCADRLSMVSDNRSIYVGFRVVFLETQTAIDQAPIAITQAANIQARSTTEIQATPTPILSRSITVLAAEEWQDTGILMRSEQRFMINATGIWSHGPSDAVQPNPYGAEGTNKLDVVAPLPTEKIGALIGRIGSGKPFLIGNQISMVAETEGQLQLSMNDAVGTYNDNIGRQEVTIVFDK